jgi:APA family basic amino acid/polyamine antiporter
MPARAEPCVRLEPVLGPFDVTMLVMGSIIGSGIFFAPAEVARRAGSVPAILGLWASGGLFAMCSAIVFAELGAMLPHAGGQYVFLREAFGRRVAFLFGWVLLTVIVSPALAFVAGVCVEHAEELGRGLGWSGELSRGAEALASLALIAGLTLLNIRGLRLGARVQNLAMLLKLAGIASIVLLGAGVVFGLVEAPPRPAVAARAGAATSSAAIGAWAPALIGVVFSYGGSQNVTAAAGEVVRPERTLPLGILWGTAGVVLLYVALNASLVALLGVEGLAATSTPVASAAGAVSALGGPLVAAMVALSTLAMLQALSMLVPRVFYAMALDGVFFRSAARIHPTWRTPWVAIALLGAMACAHVFLAGELESLLGITTQGDAFFFMLSGMALFRLRRTRPELPRPYAAHGYPFVPLAFLAFSGAMVVNVALHCGPRVLALVGGLFAVGALLYARWSR